MIANLISSRGPSGQVIYVKSSTKVYGIYCQKTVHGEKAKKTWSVMSLNSDGFCDGEMFETDILKEEDFR